MNHTGVGPSHSRGLQRLKTLVIIGMLVPLCALAQPPGHGIALFVRNFSTFDGNTPAYNALTTSLTVEGMFIVPTGTPRTAFTALVNGMSGRPVFVGTRPEGDEYRFSAAVPMGHVTPALGWNQYAYNADLRDPHHIAKPLVAELVYAAPDASGNPTKWEVYARRRYTIFDKRTDPALNPSFGGTRLTEALGTEITMSGLDALEPLLKDIQPAPSPLLFNALLTREFRGLTRANNTPLSTGLINLPGGNPKACINVGELPPAFLNSKAWKDVFNEAKALYLAYEAIKTAQDSAQAATALASLVAGPAAPVVGPVMQLITRIGVAAAKEAICPHAWPEPADFEVCASTLRAESDTLSLSKVEMNDLNLGAPFVSPPAFSIRNTLGRLDGTVDGKLQDVFIRYSLRPASLCTARPKADLTEAQLRADPAMDLARTCKGMEVDALQAFSSQEIGYQLNGDSNAEENRPEVGSPPEPRFRLSPLIPVVNPDKGICSKPAFRPYAEDLLQTGFYTRMRNALNTAWNTGTPRTQQARALDPIFSRWETGRFGDANLAGTRTGVDHQMTHDYSPGASINWNDRFATRYETEARALYLPGNGGGRTMLYSGPGWVPCQAPPQAGPPCLNNATFFGQPFDTSFFVTTGALNQVVKELAAKGMLTGQWRPTYQDLGIGPPPGVPPTSAAVLDGPTLAHLHPNFAALGATPASIYIRPLMAPYTYLLPDPPANWQGPVPQGRTPLTYQTTQYELTLTSSGKTWMTLIIDYYDPEFDLRPAAQSSLNVLVPAFSPNARGAIAVVEHAVHYAAGGCPMSTMTPPPARPVPYLPFAHPGCADEMGGALGAAFVPVLRERMLYMLSRFPAPLLWNANGQSSKPLVFAPVDKYQAEQIILYYGRLAPQP